MRFGGSLDAIDDALRHVPRDPANRRFIEAWLGWRGERRLIPPRAEIEIADIKTLLGRVILFELLGPDDIRLKVAGSQLRDHAAFEASGRNLAELTLPEQWPLRRYRLTTMAHRPCGGVTLMHGRPGSHNEGTMFETVALPLAPDHPAKPPLLISNVAVIAGSGSPVSELKPPQPILLLPEDFRFLDLGAGVPEREAP